MSRAYYNERDPYAAAWLENLIAAGAIAPGDVDTRDILDVYPADLDGYTQCHFFAGIGVWSRALREAGWPDDRPVWTGSCPCQPFSAAGARLGLDDERHLWPGWHWLIEQCRPETVFGEQVASSDGLGWADIVQADLEAAEYACGFVDTCAAGFRSFHIRQRLYFVAEDLRLAAGGVGDTFGAASQRNARAVPSPEAGTYSQRCPDGRHNLGLADASDAGRVFDATGPRCQGVGRGSEGEARDQARMCGPECGCRLSGLPHAAVGGWRSGTRLSNGDAWSGRDQSADRFSDDGMAYSQGRGCRKRGDAPRQGQSRHNDSCCDTPDGVENAYGGNTSPEWEQCGGEFRQLTSYGRDGDRDVWTDSSDGYWRDADWLFCRDGKWRPVGPGTFPLAHAAPARMGRLRAYGNGLDLAQATGFVRAYLERDLGKENAVAGNLFEWSVS